MDDALLQAFGFEKEENLWFFRKVFSEGGDNHVAAAVVVELDGGVYEGHVPMATDPVSSHGLRQVPAASLVFRSDDVRDMIGLAQTALASSQSQAGLESDEGFGSEGDSLFINIPFGGRYGDYVIADAAARNTAHREILGGYELHGEVYVAWRDDFCERLLAQAPAP